MLAGQFIFQESFHGTFPQWLAQSGHPIWAIINVVKSSAETGMKVLWVLLIVLLPLLGLIIWALAGPRGNVRI